MATTRSTSENDLLYATFSIKLKGSATVIATRGTCTYTTKAKHAQEASAGALLIVNNVEGLVHPPGPDAKDFGKGLSIIATVHI